MLQHINIVLGVNNKLMHRFEFEKGDFVKKIGLFLLQIVLGLWCAITSFISPVWLTMIFLNLTGEIYKYDYTMDSGTAGIFGAVLLVLWVLLALLPDIYFIKKLYWIGRKYVVVAIIFIIFLMVFCTAMCNWDIVEFLMR